MKLLFIKTGCPKINKMCSDPRGINLVNEIWIYFAKVLYAVQMLSRVEEMSLGQRIGESLRGIDLFRLHRRNKTKSSNNLSGSTMWIEISYEGKYGNPWRQFCLVKF